MTVGPSEGESHLDPQSETTSAPVPDQSPPRRTAGPVVLTPLLIGLWIVLGIAIVVLLVLVLT